MENPRADLPVVINGAMATVITGFCFFNAALFVCLPVDVIRTSKTVAVVRTTPSHAAIRHGVENLIQRQG